MVECTHTQHIVYSVDSAIVIAMGSWRIIHWKNKRICASHGLTVCLCQIKSTLYRTLCVLKTILLVTPPTHPPHPPRPKADPPGGRPPRSRHPSPQRQTPLGADKEQTPPPSRLPSPREANSGIRSTSGRYASYWNAFLLNIIVLREIIKPSLWLGD